MEKHLKHVTSAEGLTLLLGAGVLFAPYVFSIPDSSIVLNSIVVGGIMCFLALLRMSMPAKFELLSWLNILSGLWLFISPFVLNYTIGLATIGAVIVGLAVVIVEFYSISETHSVVTA